MRNGLLILAVGMLILAGFSGVTPTLQSATGNGVDTDTRTDSDLYTTLVNTLRAVRPDQRAWVARVVRFVDSGQLPKASVVSAMRWARKRHPQYPYPYFVQAARVIARRYHIAL